MQLTDLLTILIDGLIYASWLFMVGLGLTLIFGVLRILNLAHGGFYAVGAYVVATLVPLVPALGLPSAFSIVAMFLAALAVALVLTPILERGLLRLFYGRDEVVILFVTYGIFLILQDVTKLIWGTGSYYVTEPRMLFGNIEIGGLVYVGYDLMLIPLAVFCGLAVWLGLNRTRIGKIVLAVIHNADISACMGVNVSRIYMLAFFVGVFLAALAGAVSAPLISVQPGISVSVVILSFAVVIIGGLGSIPGAAIGAVTVGIARAFAVYELPEAEIFIVYLVMAAVLMVRPEGIFQRTQARKI